MDRNTWPYNKDLFDFSATVCLLHFLVIESKDWAFYTHKLCTCELFQECSLPSLPERVLYFRKKGLYISPWKRMWLFIWKKPILLQFCSKICPWSDSLYTNSNMNSKPNITIKDFLSFINYLTITWLNKHSAVFF